jgi:hypothetical protein
MMLSQLSTVKPPSPRSRRRFSARARATKAAGGASGGGQEGSRGLVHRVAALGDGERDDAGLRPRQALHERLDVRAGQDIVDDRADDADVRPPLVPGDEGVEAVLRVQRIRHGRVAGEDTRFGDRPVGDALPKEIVEVDAW